LAITILGCCCPAAAYRELAHTFKGSVYARAAAIVVHGACVASGMPKPTLMVFGAIDPLEAIWPGLGLRSSPEGV
jgi:hypothetical protein